MITRCMAFFLTLIMVGVFGCAPSQQQLRKTLMENPELIMDVLEENKVLLVDIAERGFAARRDLLEVRRTEKELSNPLAPVIQGDRPVLGSIIAPFTIVEYSDFLCPYCGRAYGVVQELMDKYPDKFKLVFKHFPLHEYSLESALMFEAIAMQDQEKAWKFKEMAFLNQRAIAEDKEKALWKLAMEVGVDKSRLKTDLANEKLFERIRSDEQEARAFGFEGTPMFLINGVSVRGAAPLKKFEEVVEMIETKDAEDGACNTCVE